jgi:CheY-like chemotaxis protein
MNEEKSKMHIFLADDDEDDRNFFNDAIKELKMDNEVTIFKDGAELMDYLKRPGSQLPHILFLDLNMPCKTGLDCLRDIRTDIKFKNISVAIYSTSSLEKDIENTFIEGANIYIRKPNDFNKLKKVIKDVINMNWQYHTSSLNKETFFLSI